MTERYYSSTAVTTALSSGVDDSTGSITVDSTTGFPAQFPYTLVVDINTNDEELVDVTAAAGNTLTVTRGVDGTVGIAHDSGATVRHVITGRDLQNSRDHEESDTGVHGLDPGDMPLGESTTATVENKTIDGDNNTFQNVPQSAITDLVTDQATQDSDIADNSGNISSLTTSLSNHEAATNVHGVSEVLGRTEAQTVTNKTIDGDNNTVRDLSFSSLKRALLRKSGQSGGSISPGVTSAYSSNNDTTTALAEMGGGWSPGSGAHTSQFTHPAEGYYMLFAQARYGHESSSDVDFVRVFMYLRRDMSTGSTDSGNVSLSMVESYQGTANVNHSIQLNGIYLVTDTSSIYGISLRNSANSVQDIIRDSNGTGSYFQVYYLGPE